MYLNNLEKISYSRVLQKTENNSLGNAPAQTWMLLGDPGVEVSVTTLLYFVILTPVFMGLP